MQLNKLLVAHG